MGNILAVLVLVSSIGAANASGAYFRCNSAKCKEARLADREARLSNQIATAKNSEQKKKAEIELQTTISEIERLDKEQSATAHHR